MFIFGIKEVSRRSKVEIRKICLFHNIFASKVRKFKQHILRVSARKLQKSKEIRNGTFQYFWIQMKKVVMALEWLENSHNNKPITEITSSLHCIIDICGILSILAFIQLSIEGFLPKSVIYMSCPNNILVFYCCDYCLVTTIVISSW